jgi:hypothetical protein
VDHPIGDRSQQAQRGDFDQFQECGPTYKVSYIVVGAFDAGSGSIRGRCGAPRI